MEGHGSLSGTSIIGIDRVVVIVVIILAIADELVVVVVVVIIRLFVLTSLLSGFCCSCCRSDHTLGVAMLPASVWQSSLGLFRFECRVF